MYIYTHIDIYIRMYIHIYLSPYFLPPSLLLALLLALALGQRVGCVFAVLVGAARRGVVTARRPDVGSERRVEQLGLVLSEQRVGAAKTVAAE